MRGVASAAISLTANVQIYEARSLTQDAHAGLVGCNQAGVGGMGLQACQMVVGNAGRPRARVIEAVLASVSLQPEAEGLVIPVGTRLQGTVVENMCDEEEESD